MKITADVKLSLYTLTLVNTENEMLTNEGCFGIFSTYEKAREILTNICKSFGETIEDWDNIPTGRRYFTNKSIWELEKFEVDQLVQ